MVKGNQQVHNQHFRKDWQRFVKTWFNQPAKKVARRAARVAKAKALYPRPTSSLRPVVRGQTNQYNGKVRAGRGFTIVELKAAKINPREAAGLGIAVDTRRKNRSQESVDVNVKRLNAYKSKLVVFTKKNKVTGEEVQLKTKNVFPISQKVAVEKARAPTEEEKTRNVANLIGQARNNVRYYGRRVRKFERKTAANAAALKKASKADA